MVSFKTFYNRLMLIEGVNNNHLFVLHRSPQPVEFSSIWDKGIVGGKNTGDLYGKGLYTVYEGIHDKSIYGDHILRGSVKIDNFGIFEKNVYDGVNNHKDGSSTFREHLRKMGIDLKEYLSEVKEGYSSKNAEKNWKKIQSMGYDGLIFHGRKDGYVCVIWEQGKHTFTPHSYIHKADKYGVGDMKFLSGGEEDRLYNKILNSHNIVGGIDLRGTNIRHLGNKLHSVVGNLEFQNTSVESFGNLEIVEGYIMVTGCSNLKSLGKLREGLGVYAKNSKIKDIGRLTTLEKSCDLENSNILDLGNLRYVGGYLNLRRTPIKTLSNIAHIGGYLDLRETSDLKHLGNPPTILGKILYDKGSTTETILKDAGWKD